MGIGLDIDLTRDLPGLKTRYRKYTNYPGEGPRVMRQPIENSVSGYTLLVNALAAATSTCGPFTVTEGGRKGPCLRARGRVGAWVWATLCP